MYELHEELEELRHHFEFEKFRRLQHWLDGE